MVEVARALVVEPKVFLLDEPSSGLDHTESVCLAECIERIRGEEDCAVILVEHDVGFVMRHSDRVMVLNVGEVLANGTPEEIQGTSRCALRTSVRRDANRIRRWQNCMEILTQRDN